MNNTIKLAKTLNRKKFKIKKILHGLYWSPVFNKLLHRTEACRNIEGRLCSLAARVDNTIIFRMSNRRAASYAAFQGVVLTMRIAIPILVHIGFFVKKSKVPSPALNNESILLKNLVQIPDTHNSRVFFLSIFKLCIEQCVIVISSKLF